MYVRQTNLNIIYRFRFELLWISIQLIKTLVYYVLPIIVFNPLIMLCIFPYIILINNFRSNAFLLPHSQNQLLQSFSILSASSQRSSIFDYQISFYRCCTYLRNTTSFRAYNISSFSHL